MGASHCLNPGVLHTVHTTPTLGLKDGRRLAQSRQSDRGLRGPDLDMG